MFSEAMTAIYSIIGQIIVIGSITLSIGAVIVGALSGLFHGEHKNYARDYHHHDRSDIFGVENIERRIELVYDGLQAHLTWHREHATDEATND